MMSATPAPVRCAIYTRNPSQTLTNTQHGACQAYLASRHAEGWRSVSARYDDVGYSAATLLRPALQRLLLDIRAGRIDVVVAYHPDRLTRSVTDLAELVKVFDEHDVSMASVIQPHRPVNLKFYRGATP